MSLGGRSGLLMSALLLALVCVLGGCDRIAMFAAGDPKTTDAAPTDGLPPVPAETASPPTGGRIQLAGKKWFVLGVSVPWLSFDVDFGGGVGGGGVSSASGESAARGKITEITRRNLRVVRWYMTYGSGMKRSYSTLPDGSMVLAGALAKDVLTALDIARDQGVYLQLVLFAAPHEMAIAGWFDATMAQKVAAALAPLFVATRDHPNLFAWEIVDTIDFARAEGVSQADMRGFVSKVATVARASTSTMLSVSVADPSKLSQLAGLDVDFFGVHNSFAVQGGTMAPKDTPASALGVVRPVIVSFTPARVVDAFGETLSAIYDNGYAGALAWSANPASTSDAWVIDYTAMVDFASLHPDVGPR